MRTPNSSALAHDKGLCHVIVVLSSSFAVASSQLICDRQELLRVGRFSCDEASAVLDVTLETLPKKVASDAAVAAVKERALPLTNLAKSIGQLGAVLSRSTSEADLRARAEAWASELEAAQRSGTCGPRLLSSRTSC
jgi:hypothetical protein